jgi:hypothetical protein
MVRSRNFRHASILFLRRKETNDFLHSLVRDVMERDTSLVLAIVGATRTVPGVQLARKQATCHAGHAEEEAQLYRSYQQCEERCLANPDLDPD